MTLHRLWRPWAVSAFLAICAVPACLAGRPLVTEDAGVLDAQACEVQAYALRQTERDASPAQGAHVDLACGVGSGTQLGLGYQRIRQDGESNRTLEFNGKTAIRAMSEQETGLAVAYGYGQASNPGSPLAHDQLVLRLAASRPVGDFLVHGNLGLLRTRSSPRNNLVWALAAEREGALGPVDLAVEVFGDNRNPAWAQLAARWVLIKERLNLDASIGQQASGSRPRLVTVGLKAAW